MELGVHFIDFLPGAPDKLGPTMATSARLAEQAGATMFTLADHFFQMEAIGQAQDPFRGLHVAGFPCRTDRKDHLELAGDRRDLPLSRSSRQNRQHP